MFGKSSFRLIVFDLHKWLGLRLLLIFAALFLSGTVLVFSDELEAAFHPKAWVSPPAGEERASFGEIFDNVSRAFPGGTIYVVEYQSQPWIGDRSYVTTAEGREIVVWSDPSTGEVLDAASARNSFRTILRAFHDSFLVPGRWPFVLVSASGGILLFSVVSGLITYRRFWKGFARLPSHRLGQRGYQGGLHRLLGLWTSVFLLIISVTSLYFMTSGLGMKGYTPKPAPASERADLRPAGFDGALIETALEHARAALPELDPVVMVAPRNIRDGIRFGGHTPDLAPLSGEVTVAVDPVTMDILGILRPEQKRGNARLRSYMNALHFGNWGGQAGRVVWAVSGLLSAWLLLSGAKIYTARTAPRPGNGTPRGGLRRFLDGLGLFKWLYLAFALAIAALALMRYGPL